ncbi:MAG TPA: HAMP domain-containing sensor histidine kinase [Solirubrobacteraceae bacterium]|nr:HAMP domain-containing sensor histidine kinase [Solirubrobacteraceae bacterium]
MRRSLQARVIAAAGAAIALAVAVLGGLVLARVDAQLAGALDDDLRTRAAEVARLHATTPAILTAPGALEGRLRGSTLHVQVVDPAGRIVARSAALGGRVLPDDRALRTALRERRSATGDGRLGATPIRVFAAPLGPLGRGPAAGGAVVVAGETSGLDATVTATGDAVLLAGAVAALLAMVLAAALVRAAMRPLRSLSAGAGAIAHAGDVTRRLALPGTRDEVDFLAETLNRMLASLEHARAVEQRFVADASHELRTPLTALRGNAVYLQRHGADPEALSDLRESAERLSRLLDDLITLAREDATGATPEAAVDLADVAREALALHPGPASLQLPDDGAVLARGDLAALLLAAGNLVGNARRHGPAGRPVTVSVERDGQEAVLRVSDEGDGLPAEAAAKAFDRFWRGDASREGSGLGLAIVRAVADRHGGSVEVRGSTFSLLLPLSELSQDPAVQPSRPRNSTKEIA